MTRDEKLELFRKEWINKRVYIGDSVYLHHDGWTGVKEFFNDPKIGLCSYSLSNMKLMHGGIQLAKEDVTYDVNKKPTTSEVEGSENSGFTYTVRWYDDTFAHELECANMLYDKTITENVLSLANRIDNN